MIYSTENPSPTTFARGKYVGGLIRRNECRVPGAQFFTSPDAKLGTSNWFFRRPFCLFIPGFHVVRRAAAPSVHTSFPNLHLMRRSPADQKTITISNERIQNSPYLKPRRFEINKPAVRLSFTELGIFCLVSRCCSDDRITISLAVVHFAVAKRSIIACGSFVTVAKNKTRGTFWITVHVTM